MMSNNHSLLRQQLQNARQAIASTERIRAAEQLAQQILTLPWFSKKTTYIAGYWAVGGEISLHSLLLQLPAHLNYCLPVLLPNRELGFAPWKVGDPIQQNRFGIPEPTTPPLSATAMDMVLTPLVGFDAAGYRLGMGGGWYDRTFAFRSKQSVPPYLVGVGFAIQQLETCYPQSWDIPMDAICTEESTIFFNAI